jgi:hypothetical protein
MLFTRHSFMQTLLLSIASRKLQRACYRLKWKMLKSMFPSDMMPTPGGFFLPCLISKDNHPFLHLIGLEWFKLMITMVALIADVDSKIFMASLVGTQPMLHTIM